LRTVTSNPPSSFNRYSADVRRIAGEAFGAEAERTLEALSLPVSQYFVRCNTHKISPGDLKRRMEDRGLVTTRHPVIEEALGFPVDGPIEVPSFSRSIIVDKRTAESVLQGAHVYAPGIIDCNSMKAGDEVSVRSELGELLASGKALMSATEVLTFKKGLAIHIDKRRFNTVQIRELPEFQAGLLYPQSLAAMTTSKVLDPKPGDTIVDMNCAPGGKLSHMSQLMGNSGKIYGFDRNHEKISQTRKIISQLGCTNVTLSIHDSRYLHEDMASIEADKILIDPPCSALGLRPKIYDHSETRRIESLSHYQKQFISTASKLVKPGGVIVYSVCTFSIQECEQVVEQVVKDLDLEVMEQNPIVASSSGLTQVSRPCQRFDPLKDEIGFFIAKFRR
jgi:16S rRNA C967 or C1407 C5-methylase (RsmB/RsmF family)